MPRISQKELEQATQSQNPARTKQEKDCTGLVLYTIFGKHTGLDLEGYPLTDNEKDAYAKRVEVVDGWQYFVLVGPRGKLYDPYGLLSSAYKAGRKTFKGKLEYRLVQCTREAFDNYIKFLRTKNAAWIRDAERHL